MPERDELYRRFGPILLEAVTMMFLDQINILRHGQGMPKITEQDIIDSLNNHISDLQPYDWMSRSH